MPTEIIMPKVDMVQDTGVFVEWLKKEGERVKQGEPLFVIMSDKAAIEIEAPAEGILAGCSAKKDDVIPVAQTIGYILQEGETLPKPETIKSPKALSFKEALPADFPFAKEDTTSAVAPTKDEKTIIRATPLARKTAKEHQIDLSNIKGRGERGRIHQADVLAYLENRSKVEQTYKPDTSALPPIPIPEARIKNKIPLVGARKIIAERMRLSASQIPHFYESIHVNAGELIRLQKILEPTIQSKHQLKLTYTCVLALAVSRTLMLHPNFNASLVGDEIIQWEDIHIGIATALEDNLVVPVVRNTQTKNLLEITKEINRLTAAAKERKLEPREMSGSTFTISNLGMYGIESFTALINPPEAAILAVGSIHDTPKYESNGWAVQQVMQLILSVDHRINNGAAAAKFLNDLKERLENPYILL